MGRPHICAAPPLAAASYSVPPSESVRERRSGAARDRGSGCGRGQCASRTGAAGMRAETTREAWTNLRRSKII
jgi:hypothetical protein